MTSTVLATHALCKNFDAVVTSDKVSIDLVHGEIHAIIGPNGAGKSTLIAQICGSLKPTSGRVEFLGRDVTNKSTIYRARAGLARTFQISALAAEHTVLQNALLGTVGAMGRPWRFFKPVMQHAEPRQMAENALARVGLEGVMHQRVGELSHGQRRQLEVGIALTMSPKAFVMDEPMAGLGTSGSKDLTELLDKLRHEAPILLVEHDMDVVFALADRISVLVYGKIIATGTVDEIRNNKQVRRAYLGEGI